MVASVQQSPCRMVPRKPFRTISCATLPIRCVQVDDKIYAFLDSLPAENSCAAIDELAQCNLSRINNVPGYFIGILRKHKIAGEQGRLPVPGPQMVRSMLSRCSARRGMRRWPKRHRASPHIIALPPRRDQSLSDSGLSAVTSALVVQKPGAIVNTMTPWGSGMGMDTIGYPPGAFRAYGDPFGGHMAALPAGALAVLHAASTAAHTGLGSSAPGLGSFL